MRWSFRIARIAGIEVRIHVTFLLLVGFVAYAFALPGVLFVLALFGCVLLHEFGHALAARRFGIRTPDITLWPIGGVARLQRMPEEPWQELVVALAGPAVNVLIVAVVWLLAGVAPDPEYFLQGGDTPASFLYALAQINLVLALFNMIPAFPMDGGRVLRALLAMRLDYARATRVAAWVGQSLAIIGGTIGVLWTHNPIHVFIAFFVYMGAAQEAAAAQMKDAATGLLVQEAMVTEFLSLPEDARLDEAVEALLRTSQHEFPVVDATGHVHGVLTRDDMIAALRRTGVDTPVSGIMRTGLPMVHPLDPFDEAFRQMQECQCPALPVVDGTGRLVGLITPENVGELMLVHSVRPQNGSPSWRPHHPGPLET